MTEKGQKKKTTAKQFYETENRDLWAEHVVGGCFHFPHCVCYELFTKCYDRIKIDLLILLIFIIYNQ